MMTPSTPRASRSRMSLFCLAMSTLPSSTISSTLGCRQASACSACSIETRQGWLKPVCEKPIDVGRVAVDDDRAGFHWQDVGERQLVVEGEQLVTGHLGDRLGVLGGGAGGCGAGDDDCCGGDNGLHGTPYRLDGRVCGGDGWLLDWSRNSNPLPKSRIAADIMALATSDSYECHRFGSSWQTL